MNIRELEAKHTELMGQVRELQKGVATPETDAKMDALLAEADGVRGEIKTQLDAQSRKQRIDEHYGWGQQSAGTPPGMASGGQSDSKLAPTLQMKSGWLTADVDGLDVKVYSASQLRTSKQLQATCSPEYKSAFDAYLRGEDYDRKALSEGVDSAGGYLVPPDVLARVITRVPGLAVVEERATVINTSRDRVQIPRVAAASSDATMYGSAVSFTMVGETPAAGTGNTEPVFERPEANVYKAKLETTVGNDLIADAEFDLIGYLGDEFRVAATLGKDDRYLTGSGVGEPLGLVNDTTITSVKSGSAALLTADGIKDLVYAIPAQYALNTTIALSLDAMKAIRKLKDSSNRYIWDPGWGGIVGGAPATIEGRPYVVTDFLDAVGANNYPAVIGDFKRYWAINRKALSIKVLDQLRGREDQTVFVGFIRFGGMVTIPEAFRRHKCEA